MNRYRVLVALVQGYDSTDRDIEALMAFSDDTPLAPAAAFARKRHLFRRMVLISKEAVMSSRRVVVTGAVIASRMITTQLRYEGLARNDEPADVEAVAPAPDGGVWVGDIGDNLERRDEVWVHRVTPGRSEPAPRYGLRYPGGPRDAETLLAMLKAAA